jgi:tetratricopeptide (TPR) repeat protein
VGPYAIDALLGQGGMGAVYLAHRADGQFEQQVAIKIIDMPLASDLFRERFRMERQILAGLSHPYIARLLDGGISDANELYLVMEYVDGISITRFCEQQQLTIAQRLRLFQKVCEAVQYAHQHLIVHRDLKPDNILVTADGSPRLLDFGTAKILVADLASAAHADLTRQGVQAFTPRYASPEQVLGQPITLASDTYSLGVLLYLLLTNAMPYELTEFTTEEMVRVICGQDPVRPSAVASAVDRLTPDIDSILLKALRKEPSQRYGTVEQLSSDIQAYLDDRPVRSRHGNLRYRTGKFVRRNRLLLAGVAVLAVSLVGGVVGVGWQARVANRQRLKAEARSADLRELSSGLLSELDDAIKQLPGSTSAQRLIVTRMLTHLDRMSQDGGDDQQTQLDVADAYMRVGNLEGNPYDQNIGDAAGGLASVEKAVGITEGLRRRHPQDAAVLHAYGMAQQSRGEILYGVGRSKEALEAGRAASDAFGELADRPQASSAAASEAATAYGGMGDTLGQTGRTSLGDVAAALVVYRKALGYQELALRRDPHSERALRSLPISLMKLGNMEVDTDPWQAVEQYRRSLEAMGRMPAAQRQGVPYERTLTAIQRKLGVALTQVGAYGEAMGLFAQVESVLEAYRRADAEDGRALTDLMVVVENESEVYLDRMDPVLNPGNREVAADRGRAEALMTRSLALQEELVRRNPSELSVRSQLANERVLQATMEYERTPSRSSAAIAAAGIAALREMARPADTTPFVLDEASSALLWVKPESLREPKETIDYAQRALALIPGKPVYSLTLAQAYRAEGDVPKARETARKGLALLAPLRAGEAASRAQKLLEWELR